MQKVERRKTLLPYGKQQLDEADIDAVLRVLRSDFLTQGPAIAQFERKVAERVGARYAVAFCNGTAALHGACDAAGIGSGDEVITSPITFLASSNCVLYAGGTPVFADIDPRTYNLSPAAIEAALTERTKAIIAVDFAGQPSELDAISALAQRRGLTLIHDAAHSLGASYKDCPIGSFGDMTMFSFHPVKSVTSGEGGIIVTSNERFYRKLLKFRNHGVTREADQWVTADGAPWYYEMQELGYNYRMTDLQAALGHSQMDKLDRFIERRREIAMAYTEAFAGMDGLIVPYQSPQACSSWHLYVLGWRPESFGEDREAIFTALRQENIGVQVHYIPVYKQPYYRDRGYDKGNCPQAEAYYGRSLSLPIFPAMTEEDVGDVVAAVRKVYHLHKLK